MEDSSRPQALRQRGGLALPAETRRRASPAARHNTPRSTLCERLTPQAQYAFDRYLVVRASGEGCLCGPGLALAHVAGVVPSRGGVHLDGATPVGRQKAMTPAAPRWRRVLVRPHAPRPFPCYSRVRWPMRWAPGSRCAAGVFRGRGTDRGPSTPQAMTHPLPGRREPRVPRRAVLPTADRGRYVTACRQA